MVKTGQADIRRARDIAHCGWMITLLREDTRSSTQNKLELLVEFRIADSGWEFRIADCGFRISDFVLVTVEIDLGG
jgi:hypothetical protein